MITVVCKRYVTRVNALNLWYVWIISLAYVLFTFSYPYTVEKGLYLGQIFGMEILMDLRFSRRHESENSIFSGWSAYVSICYQHNSKTNYNRSSI